MRVVQWFRALLSVSAGGSCTFVADVTASGLNFSLSLPGAKLLIHANAIFNPLSLLCLFLFQPTSPPIVLPSSRFNPFRSL